MVQAATKPLTLAEFLELPETKPASEFISGTIIQKPMPQGKHSLIQRELSFALTVSCRAEKTAQAFPELRCTLGDHSIVPDIAVICAERIPRDDDGGVANAFNLYPDWTIEILSPNQSQHRVMRNVFHCLDHGTEMGWLIDLKEQLVIVYYGDRRPAFFDQPEQVLPSPSFVKDFDLALGEMFAWLLE
ncbi:MAG: Uma2 family endonuclease [Limnothrix sp.]